ncbi:hypothetical protein ACFLQ2_00030 [archaeon]
MASNMGFTIAVIVLLAGGATALFMSLSSQTDVDYVEATYKAVCTNSSLVVSIHSLERQRIFIGNITVAGENVTCHSGNNYLIANRNQIITCWGSFEKGEHQLLFNKNALNVTC